MALGGRPQLLPMEFGVSFPVQPAVQDNTQILDLRSFLLDNLGNLKVSIFYLRENKPRSVLFEFTTKHLHPGVKQFVTQGDKIPRAEFLFSMMSTCHRSFG